MLCQFTVKNFQCIKEELTLDMQAMKLSEHQESLIRSKNGEEFLPLAAIYGPNGAGKSTVLLALQSLVSKLTRPLRIITDADSPIQNMSAVPVRPYKFSPETLRAPTEFEIFFRTQTCEYQYQLHLLENKITWEALYKKKLEAASRYTTVFTREKDRIVLKGSFRQYNTARVSDNLPLLSYFAITHGRNAVIHDVTDWLTTKFIYTDYGNLRDKMRVPVAHEDRDKEIILHMLEEMGIDISDYTVEEKEDKVQVKTHHQVGGQAYTLDLSEESSGTIKIFNILPRIAVSLLYGATLVMDEPDAKLHPLLLEYIIRLYSNPESNKKGAQLIFTSHDITTMNREVFRRDEIWFVAQNGSEGAKMYSLAELNVRNDLNYSANYLKGKFGADPYLKRCIDWGNIDA